MSRIPAAAQPRGGRACAAFPVDRAHAPRGTVTGRTTRIAPSPRTIEGMSDAIPSRPRWALLGALLLASALSTALVAARVLHTGRLTYAFLVYNLVLAWIPLGFAAAAEQCDRWRSRWGAALTALCGAAWLAFFPNAPYIMTDLMHLRVSDNRLLWLDLTALQAFAWTGLALGFVSLMLVQRLVARRVGRALSWCFAGAALAASAFGIYLGRVRRWNSWDVVRDPAGLVADMARPLLHPFANAHVIAFCAVLAAFLFTAYVVMAAWTGLQEEA